MEEGCQRFKDAPENTKYTKKQTKERVEALLASLSLDAPSVLVDEGSSTILIRQIAKENLTYLNKALEAFFAKIDNQPVGRGAAVISEYDLTKDNRNIYRCHRAADRGLPLTFFIKY